MAEQGGGEKGVLFTFERGENMQEENSKPPFSNTGVIAEEKKGLKAVIDWLQVTFFTLNFEEIVKEILNLNIDDFKCFDIGKNGYTFHARFGDIFIYENANRPDMGRQLFLSGEGVRQLEYYLAYQKRSWKDFFRIVTNTKYKIPRLDIALDDFDAYFKILALRKKISKGETESKFRLAYHYQKMKLKDGSSQGESIYFGSPQSELRFRFYEKNYEQMQKLKLEELPCENWNRYELTFKNDKAKMIVVELLNGKTDLELIAKSVLGQYLRVINIDKQIKKKSDQKTWKPWGKLLKDAQEISLTMESEPMVFERTLNWLSHQAAGSMKAARIASDTLARDCDLIDKIIDNAKLSKRTLALMEDFIFRNKNTIQESALLTD